MNPPTDLHPLTLSLLAKRGIRNEDIHDFLDPSYEKHIGDPFDIHGVPQAVERIVQAMKAGEKICIYSDYDCDGIPGGVLLREFFDTVGYPVEMYIPHRHNEGYGVHIHAIDALKKRGVTLIITVDSGITNIEEVAYAKSIGVDFIVTDHHLPITEEIADDKRQTTEEPEVEKSKKQKATGKRLVQVVPAAVAVINSKQDACTYHDDMLCGCAVAWKLACAVLTRLRNETIPGVRERVEALPEGYEKWLLDLVGISTIADMVPLRKENRALAHFGLKVLRKTKRPGLLHIFNEQRMKKENLVEDDVAFTIAPRINAASRMGIPMQAHEMLYEKDTRKAETFARDLEALNTERKTGVKDIVSTLSFDHEVYKNDVIVVGDMSWGPGILGLIAQNIIDETGKPTFVWGQGEDKSQVKGSCRSLGDVHVVELMARVGHDIFTHWGGHEGAGGFAVLVENISKLSDALNDAIKHVELKEIGSQQVESDGDLSMNDINEVTYGAIAPLAPFGEGNPKPVFRFENVTPSLVRRFGKKNEHIEVAYPKAGGSVKAIKFFAGKDMEEKAKVPHTLLAHLEKSYFAGKTELRLRIVEII
jgi:single-stranded-DNA-specific exonuclease